MIWNVRQCVEAIEVLNRCGSCDPQRNSFCDRHEWTAQMVVASYNAPVPGDRYSDMRLDPNDPETPTILHERMTSETSPGRWMSSAIQSDQ